MNYNSKSFNPKIISIYLDIQLRSTPFDRNWWDKNRKFNETKFLNKIYKLRKISLVALKQDLKYWNDEEQYNFKEIIQTKAKDYEKMILFAKVMYGKEWKLQAKNSKIYEIYLPIFIFSIFEIRCIDYTYRTSVLPKIKKLTKKELLILEKEARHWNSSQKEELLHIIAFEANFVDIYQAFAKKLFGERWIATSRNPNVLRFCKEFAKGYAHHSSYWYMILRDYFTGMDYQDLQTELANWSLDDLGYFLSVIMNEYGGNGYLLNRDISYWNDRPREFEQATITILERFNLILFVLKLLKENRGVIDFDIRETIFDDLDFINDHFYILLKKDKNVLNKMKEILELVGVDDFFDQGGIREELQAKIKSIDD